MGRPLERALEIMDVVSAHPSGATVKDVAEKLSLPIATAYRQIRTLVDLGYVKGEGRHGRYLLGERFLRQYHNNISDKYIINLVKPYLRQLCMQLNEVVYFNSLVNQEVRAITAEFPITGAARTLVMPGDLFPFHATASGKVLCAFQGAELAEQLVSKAELKAFRKNTITDREVLWQEIQKVNKQGFAVSDDEIDEDVFAISVPVNIERVGIIYSLGVNGPKSRMLASRNIDSIVRDLQTCAADIAQLLRDLWES